MTRKSLRNRIQKIKNRNDKKSRYGMLGQGLTGVDAREVSRRGVTGEARRINAINRRSRVTVTRKSSGNTADLSKNSGVIKDSNPDTISYRVTEEDIRHQIKTPVIRPMLLKIQKLKPAAYLERPQKTSRKHHQIIRKPQKKLI